MNRDDVMAMARDAGFCVDGGRNHDGSDGRFVQVINDLGECTEELVRFAALVAAKERENLTALIARAKQDAVAAHIAMFGSDIEAAVAAEREACARMCEAVEEKFRTPDATVSSLTNAVEIGLHKGAAGAAMGIKKAILARRQKYSHSNIYADNERDHADEDASIAAGRLQAGIAGRVA